MSNYYLLISQCIYSLLKAPKRAKCLLFNKDCPMPEYLLEFTQHGHSVKVTAVDPESGIEASVIAAASLSKQEMGQLAVRKLHYVMEKKASDASP